MQHFIKPTKQINVETLSRVFKTSYYLKEKKINRSLRKLPFFIDPPLVPGEIYARSMGYGIMTNPPNCGDRKSEQQNVTLKTQEELTRTWRMTVTTELRAS